MGTSLEDLLQQVQDRDTEIWVLLQRTRLLLNNPAAPVDKDSHGFGGGTAGRFDALKEQLTAACGCQEKVMCTPQW